MLKSYIYGNHLLIAKFARLDYYRTAIDITIIEVEKNIIFLLLLMKYKYIQNWYQTL